MNQWLIQHLKKKKWRVGVHASFFFFPMWLCSHILSLLVVRDRHTGERGRENRKKEVKKREGQKKETKKNTQL